MTRSMIAKNHLLNLKYADEDELKQMEKQIRSRVSEAAEFATNAPEPDLSELYTDIYAMEG